MNGPTTRPETDDLPAPSLLHDPVLQAMEVGLAVVRISDLVVLEANPAWVRLFDGSEHAHRLWSAEGDAVAASAPVRRAIQRDGRWAGTVPARTADGSLVRWCRLSVVATRLERHGPVWLVNAVDVSGEHDAVADARTSLARHRRETAALLRVATFKDEFLTVVSHDLRTPLTAVRGFVDLMRTGRVRTDAAGLRSVLDRMAASLQDMTLLVDRLLYWGMLQSGTASIAPRSLGLQREVLAIVALLEDLLRDRDVHVDVPGDLVARVDPVALERMLVQLLANAVKYSAPGSRIAVTAEPVDPDETGWQPVPEVRVAVSDEGRGIRPDRLASLSARLEDGSTPGAGSAGPGGGAGSAAPGTDTGAGTGADGGVGPTSATAITSGLGLGIVQRYAALHGGRVQIDSRRHHGTTAAFTLPGRARGD